MQATDIQTDTVATPAETPAPFSNFPASYARALTGISDALNAEDRSQERICDAFAFLGALRPVKVQLPSDATREEKFAARDSFKADERIHQRALRTAFDLASEAGATVAEKFSGAISATGNVTVRQTLSAKLAAPKRAPVRL